MQDLLVRSSAWLSFVLYIATYVLWLRGQRLSSVRWCWTVAWLIFAVHVALAFHIVHHWSNASAYEATTQQSGVGEGLYFNYATLLLWGADVVRWWMAPQTTCRWYVRVFHALLGFMWLNATVFFATGCRWAWGTAGFLLLGLEWLRWRRKWRARTDSAFS
jgi:hypothetical protein